MRGSDLSDSKNSKASLFAWDEKDYGARSRKWPKAWPLYIPLLCILIAQVSLFASMSFRGFDFTDESYYVLSYLDWRSAVASTTFFGAFLELPFRMLGQSIPAVRILSLVLLLVCGAYMMRSAGSFSASGATHIRPSPLLSLVGASAALNYFGSFSTMRAPSYNLLAFCSMLVATGLLLRFARSNENSSAANVQVFFYGIAVAACTMNKVSTGGLLVATHSAFLLAINPRWSIRTLLVRSMLAFTGVALAFAVLQGVHPQWFQAFREGMLWARTTDSSYGLPSLVKSLLLDMKYEIGDLWPWGLGFLGFSVLTLRTTGASRRVLIHVWITLMIVLCCVVLSLSGWGHRWLPVTSGTVVVLCLAGLLIPSDEKRIKPDRSLLALSAMMLALPLVFSFGTNGRVLSHSLGASAFAVAAITIGLMRLSAAGGVPTLMLGTSLALLAIPPAFVQMKTAVSADRTYRQLSALGKQTSPVQLGAAGGTLLVDEAVKEAITALQQVARSAKFTAGSRVQDFTGDGSGLIYAMGARPLAVSWTGGGYPGSQIATARILSLVPVESLRGAWLLTSDNNPRAIPKWAEMIQQRLGPNTHVRVGSFRMRATYRWNEQSPEYLDVQLWKPR